MNSPESWSQSSSESRNKNKNKNALACPLLTKPQLWVVLRLSHRESLHDLTESDRPPWFCTSSQLKNQKTRSLSQTLTSLSKALFLAKVDTTQYHDTTRFCISHGDVDHSVASPGKYQSTWFFDAKLMWYSQNIVHRVTGIISPSCKICQRCESAVRDSRKSSRQSTYFKVRAMQKWIVLIYGIVNVPTILPKA